MARTQFTLPPAIKDTAEKEGRVNTHLWLRSLFFCPGFARFFSSKIGFGQKGKRKSGSRKRVAKKWRRDQTARTART